MDVINTNEFWNAAIREWGGNAPTEATAVGTPKARRARRATGSVVERNDAWWAEAAAEWQ